MLQLMEMTISADKLRTLAKADLKLLLGLTKTCNDLTIAFNTVLFSMNTLKNAHDEYEKMGAGAQMSYSVRMLAGHLHETAKFIRQFVRPHVIDYGRLPSLHKKIIDTTARFNKYFSKDNPTSDLRNKLSFHTDMKLLFETFEKYGDHIPFKTLVNANYSLQHLFVGIDHVVTASYFELPSTSDPFAAFQAVMGGTLSLAGDAILLFISLFAYILEEKLGLNPVDTLLITAENSNPLATIRLPYFCIERREEIASFLSQKSQPEPLRNV